MEITQASKPRLLTVSQFATEHPAFSQAALRHLIFDADKNGFNSVIRRIGRRKVLLDERSFFLWVDTQQKERGLA
jgi:hypothetical protein